MKKLRVVQLGAEHDHASAAIETLRKLDDFELLGYSGEPFEHFSRFEGVPRYTAEQLLDMNPDAVVVEAFDLELAKYAEMAIDRGFPVYMDKQGGADHEAFVRTVRKAQAKNLVFHTGYMYRYNPAVQKIFEMVKDGSLGEIYSVEAHMDCLHSPKKRAWLSHFPGGEMFYLGCHLIDLIYRLQGEPLEVTPINAATGLDGVTAEDFAYCTFRYPNGVSFLKSCAAEPGGYARRQLVVCGSKATVELKPFEIHDYKGGPQYTEMTVTTKEDEAREGWRTRGRTEKLYADRYENMFRGFAAMVRGERENPYDYDYEIKLHKLLMKCCK